MIRRKKILLLHNSLDTGGAEKLRFMLLSNIDRDKYDISICCINEKGRIGKDIESIGYIVDELGLDPGPKNIKTTLRIVKYLKQKKIDILHTSLFNSNFHGRIAGMACRVPHIIIEEHSEHYQYQNFRHIFYILADFFLSGVTRHIICCSDAVRKDIARKENLPREKLITIKNCIDTVMYSIKEPKELIRKRHNIYNDEIVFITAGSLSEKKAHSYLLDALSELKSMGIKFKYLIAGDGPLKDALNEKCKSLNISKEVIFLGSVDNIQDYLEASDIFILPSVKEGLPIALLEAMFMGLGCVVTDVGSNNEVMRDNINGIVVPPRDKDALKKAVLFYIENKPLINEHGNRCKKIIESEYTINRYVNDFYKLWDNLDVKN